MPEIITINETISKNRLDDYYRESAESENAAVKQASKNYDWYKKDSIGIAKGIREGLRRIMGKDESIEWFNQQVVNDVPRVVNRLSLVYMNPAERVYEGLSEEQIKYVTFGLNKWMKEVDKQATLLNTVLVRPIWNAKRKRFTYSIMGCQFATVKTDDNDFYEAIQVSYQIPATLQGRSKEQLINVYWTESEHWAEDLSGNDVTNKLPDMFPEGRINPYGRIPFAVMRLELCNDFWGDGLSDFVNTCESNSILKTGAYIKQWFTFGVGIGINLNRTDNTMIKPNALIAIDDVKISDEVTPDLKFVTPDHDVKGDLDFIDNSRRSTLNSLGMSGSSLSEDSTAQSGFAKMIDNLEIMDFNNDKIAIFEEFERDLFELQKLELRLNGIMVNESAKLVNVLHQPYEFPKSNTEIWIDREKEYEFDMSGPVKWLMQDNPSLTKEDAEQIIIENKSFKQKTNIQAVNANVINRMRNV